ncbi:hypothetical protein [Marinimicrobium agarilyticum]|uniref:hypothetical protein n=1 Tax=Marinimicrobium agarilyticum TaxID=306546 RepID=UPI0004822200|nr:hypothetical protein [Marinimicrobium agarilyticum]
MKYPSFVIGLAIFLQACALTPLPYITECDQPACERQASEQPLPNGASGGVEVVTNSHLSFHVGSPPKKLVHQQDMLFIIFPDDTKIAASTLSVSDFGLENSELSAYSLLSLSLMEKFSSLPNSLSRAERHVIRSIKVDAMSGDETVRYTRETITIYLYSEADDKYKAYVVSGKESTSWTMLDFYGLKGEDVKDVLSTIKPF